MATANPFVNYLQQQMAFLQTILGQNQTLNSDGTRNDQCFQIEKEISVANKISYPPNQPSCKKGASLAATDAKENDEPGACYLKRALTQSPSTGTPFPHFPGVTSTPFQNEQQASPHVSTNSTGSDAVGRKRAAKRPVPDTAKDTRYWVKRMRNNEAARRSRDARRLELSLHNSFDNFIFQNYFENIHSFVLVFEEFFCEYS